MAQQDDRSTAQNAFGEPPENPKLGVTLLTSFSMVFLLLLAVVYGIYISLISSYSIPRITPEVVAAFEEEISMQFPQGTEFVGTSSNATWNEDWYHLSILIPADTSEAFLKNLNRADVSTDIVKPLERQGEIC